MAKHNLVHGWRAPRPISDDIRHSDIPFVDSRVFRGGDETIYVLNSDRINTTTVTLNSLIKSYRNLSARPEPGDKRVFHHLTSQKQRFLYEIGVTLGEVAYVEARYGDIMFVHTFRAGNSFNPSGKMTGFAPLGEVYRELKTIEHDESVWAWALLMRQTMTDPSRAVDLMLIARENNLSFDDVAWRIEDYIGINFLTLLEMALHDIDPNLVISLNPSVTKAVQR